MKKIDFKVFMLMLLALLFADVVPAAEPIDSKKRERLWWCSFIQCEDPPAPPSTPLATTKPKAPSKTSTNKS